jgi:hypothetical protein
MSDQMMFLYGRRWRSEMRPARRGRVLVPPITGNTDTVHTTRPSAPHGGPFTGPGSALGAVTMQAFGMGSSGWPAIWYRQPPAGA